MKLVDRTVAALLLVPFIMLSGCTKVQNPATGEAQYTSLDREEEAALGKQEHERVLEEYGGAYVDPALQAYVDRIGNSLKGVSELPEDDFTFTLLDSPIVNAFALPGGYVYVSRGLLALTDNEAELAGVIGHEIGHVTARHTAQRYDKQIQGQVLAQGLSIGGAILGGLLGGDVGAQAGGELGGQVGGLGAQAYVTGYSRQQEFQADELGVRYLAKAGYQPQAMSTFLDALSANDALNNQLSGGSQASLPSWFSTHPRTADRVARAADQAEVAEVNADRIDRDALLDEIDGLIWGQSPAQGYVLGQRFAHPELRFEFEVPPGFTISNQPQAVLARSNDAVILFDLARSNASPQRYIGEEWTEGAELDRLDSFSTANGYDAAFGEATVRLQRGNSKAAFIAIRGKGNTIYRFLMISPRIGAGEERDIRSTADSFSLLSDADVARLKPQRIRVVTVQPGDTIDTFARRMDVGSLPKEHFMTLNGLGPGSSVVAGERVKIIVRD